MTKRQPEPQAGTWGLQAPTSSPTGDICGEGAGALWGLPRTPRALLRVQVTSAEPRGRGPPPQAPSLALVDWGTASRSGLRGAVCRPAQHCSSWSSPTAELSARPLARLHVLEDVWRVTCHLVPGDDAAAPSRPPAQRVAARSVRSQTVTPAEALSAHPEAF